MMRKFYVILSFLFSVFFFFSRIQNGEMTATLHSSSIEGIHDFLEENCTIVRFFAEIPLETFQRSIYSPLRYYIFPVLEYSMERRKNHLRTRRQYFTNDFVALALYGKFHFYRGFLKILLYML